jgi:CubicO group peptidase (beta-lactamase class C family)
MGGDLMRFSKLEQFAFDKMSETKLPGVSAAVIEGTDVIWSRGFGFRDLVHGLPATPHTLYAIASVTKSFTAIAIMQLAERGKLSVDDPLEKYVSVGLQTGREPVRIRHLLSHTSGLPALAYAESMIRGAVGAGEHWLPVGSYDDLMTFLTDAHDWVVAAPGERWFYLNEGYALLGCIIEQCSGTSYEDFVRQNILEPLGMSRSFFDKAPVEKDQDAATPYIITTAGERMPSIYPHGGIKSDGGLISTVTDLARYVSMLLGAGALGGTQILTPESVSALETPRVSRGLEGPFGDLSYGYGLGVTPDFLGHCLINHSGGLYVATAWMGYIRDRGVGIVLLSNGSGYPLSQMGMYGLAVALGADPEALPFVRNDTMLKELEGTYETYRGTMQVKVEKAGEFLQVEFADKYTTDVAVLVPETIGDEARVFYTLSGGNKLRVEFTVSGAGVDLLYERYRMKRTGPLP